MRRCATHINWTDRLTDEVIELWRAGQSASDITRIFGIKYKLKLSRNAVLGKLYRMGILGNRNRKQTDTQAACAQTPSRRKVVSLATAAHIAPLRARLSTAANQKTAGMQITDLTRHTCKYPIGHPGDTDFHFCGAAVKAGAPYCPAHCHIAFAPYKSDEKSKCQGAA